MSYTLTERSIFRLDRHILFLFFTVAHGSSSFESSAVVKILKDLHEELKRFHEETTYALRTQYGPRWSHVMERRQRNLESRMDSLEARNAVVAFKESGSESGQQQLKTLRHDLEILHRSVSEIIQYESAVRRFNG